MNWFVYRLEIHVAVSNINMDVRILFQGQFAVIVSSSLLWTGLLLIKQETE